MKNVVNRASLGAKKTLKLNSKGLYGYMQSLLSRSPQPRDNREMSERRPSEERTLLAPLPQRFARYAVMLIMLLTLGVGQMWAEYEYGKYNLYLDISQNTGWKDANGYVGFHFSYNENSSGEYIGRYKATLVEGNIYCVSASSHNNAYIRGIKAARWATSDDGNTDNNWNIAGNTHPDNSSSHSSKNCIKIPSNGWDNCTVSWDAYIPTVSSVALSYNVVPSSGSGTSGDPYIVPTGTTVRVTATPTSVIDDSQMTMKYKWDSGSWGTTKYKDLNCSTNNTTYSTTVTCKNEFNSNKGNGADATVYFKAVSTPTISLAVERSSTEVNKVYSGETLTLVASPSNAGSTPTIVYEYSTNNSFPGGSTTTIATTTSTSQSWTVPANTAQATLYVRARVTSSGYECTSSTSTLTAYGKKTIHVKNTNNWETLYLYAWDGEGTLLNGEWPGTTGAGSNGLSCTRTGGQWWDVVITSQVSGFILNANGSGDANQTDDLAYTTFTDDRCLAIGTESGKKTLTNTAVTCPTVPTLVTTTATPTSVTNVQMTLGGSIGTNGNDNITDYGFYWGTTDACGTMAQIATSDKTGAISKQLTGLTAGTTYYFKAYATNGQGTSYGDVQNYKLPYKVTVSTNTGCASITNSGTNYTNSTIEVTATKTTGYTFSSWTTTKGTQTSTSSTSTTNTLVFTPSADNATIQPVYNENMTTVNLVASPTGKGTFTRSEAAVTSVSAGVDTHPTVTAVPATGYRLTGTIWSESSEYISISATNAATTTITATGTTGNTANLTATFTPITYTVHFNGNGATSGSMSDQTGIAYDSETPLTTNAFERTGYTFQGWATAADGSVERADGAAHNNLSSTQGATVNLYAVWQAKTYTVTLDVDEDHQGTITSATENQTVTYNAATTTVPNRPTAEQGYGLEGYYTDHNGAGTKLINGNGTWIASVEGYTDATGNWIHDDGVTLYAYYKKAEITALTLSAAVVALGATITVTPTIEPTPVGPTIVCWEVQYSNGTTHPSQPTFTPGAGNAVSFPVPSASATYIIQAKLAKGSDCPADPSDVLSTLTTTFQVAGSHTVTVRYQDASGRTLQASGSVEARPLAWTEESAITPPTITGYTFDHWDAGDGVTIKNGDADPVTTTTTSSIQIKANYPGTLTAVYNKKNVLYFNNTLGWERVYVYFYSDGNYWQSSKNTSGSTNEHVYGSGAQTTKTINATTPFSAGHYEEMTRIAGTNIYYFDWQAKGWSHTNYVTFTKDDQYGYEYFDDTEVVRLADAAHYYDKPGTMMMYVPLPAVYENRNKHDEKITKYYTEGYWMNYPENTGYTLHIYDSKKGGTEDELQSIPFEFTGDKTMPMTVKVELNANREYGYEIHRADGAYYGNTSKVLKINDSGDETPEALTVSQRGGIQTSVAGDYEFTLNFGDQSGYKYLIGVHYPVAANDYRVVYSDEIAWSKAAHTTGWYHPSRAIHKEDGAKDIVSFYVSKADGANASMKFQYASAIEPSTGVVTWTDVPSGTINLSGITETGVYNFHLTQDASSISVEKIEPYKGNYYIRTDCAGSTKWENFRTTDHQMTYSDYAETTSGYSHYFAHWVTSGTNVKFVIANDYSQCITDTLEADYGTTIATIASGGALSSASANIRFMWNQATNKISRAYIGGSSNITDRFLVLEGDAKMYDANGNALTGTNQDHRMQGNTNTYLGTDNQVILNDDENFLYERTIKVNTSARAKLTAKYNNNVQYFKGSEGAFADGTTVELLGGAAAGQYTMRIVYDFKTNRLVTAYLPEEEISGSVAINADVMLIRNHQEAGQQLTFTSNDAELTDVKTVYGVMRFNRWTLNNKQTTGGHTPVGDPKSIYERSLYWISFPFDVNLGDVFGFGTYGVDWVIEYYDGAARALEGYWADSPGFWKMYTNRAGVKLEAGKGYVLAIDLDRMKDNNTTFWANNIEQVELFFPSAANIATISQTTAHTTVAEHTCTIDRTNSGGTSTDILKNRTKADAHWNLIGVPSYANYGTELYSNKGLSTTITWNSSPYTNDLPFLYEWNATDDSYTVQSGTTYPFKAMHAYMVQYHGDLYWSLASATPTPASPIVARRTYAEKPIYEEFRLELQQNEKMVDQTFVKLSNDEEASANFVFNEDLTKEFNSRKGNIYTLIENYLPAAGNTLPVSEQTTVVPVGVKISTEGDYTFAMPEGTDGIGVTLIDNETGARTSLSALDYTVHLTAGEYTSRFVMEISPVQNTTTDIEEVPSDQVSSTPARKTLIDGVLYIVKDGKMFDARGASVK